jgi:hypothetical protein
VGSNCTPKIVEIGVFNTTTTDFVASVTRLSAAGTQGTGLTEAKHQDPGPAADATGFNTHTADATAGDEIVRATIAAAKGAGMVWTFGAGGLWIPTGTGNGIGILCPTGTGQVFDFYFVWDE